MAIILSLLSSLVWGASDFAGGLMSRRRPAVVVAAWSAAFGLVIASAALLLTGTWEGLHLWLGWGMAAGAAGEAGLICYYLALATGTMGVVAPVTSLGVAIPVVVGIASGESPSAAALTGIAIAVVGIVLTSGPEFTAEGTSARPVVIAAIAGVLFGVFFICMDRGSEHSPLITLWVMRATITAGFVVVAALRRTTGGLDLRDYALVFGIAAGDLGANLFFGIASTKGFVSVTSVLSSLFPVVTVLLAGGVLHERLRRIQVIGVVVTMVGVALISSG
ncbi:MAG: EamA family transporter [Nocardioidaceae bacterium]